jgi:hypothetical protein
MPAKKTLGWLLLTATFGAAQTVDVRITLSKPPLEIELYAPDLPAAQMETRQRDVLLQFAGPVNFPGLKVLADHGLAAATGYDTLLLQTAEPMRCTLRRAGTDRYILRLEALPAPAAEPPGREVRQRLALLEVQLAAATGDLRAAQRRLDDAVAPEPPSPVLLQTQASLAMMEGLKMRALRFLEEAQRIAPEDEDVTAARREISVPDQARISMAVENKVIGTGWVEYNLGTSGQAPVGAGHQIGWTVDQTFADLATVRRPDGTMAEFHGTRQRAELYWEKNDESGRTWRATLFGASADAGAGLSVTAPDMGGRTTVMAELGRPFWEFAEGLFEGGRRDRVRVDRQFATRGGWSVWAGAGWNRYGLAHLASAATSAGATGGVNWNFRRAWPGVLATYGFDGEYRLTLQQRTGQDGRVFAPLPLLSREVHTVGGALIHAVKGGPMRGWRFESAGGYAVDRLGGRGPYVNLRAVYDRSGRWRIEVLWDHRLNRVDTVSGSVNRLQVGVTCRF